MKLQPKEIIITFGVIFAFLFLAMSPIINANIVKNDIFNQVSKLNTEGEGDSVYDLLIVSPNYFADALKPLLCHKNNMGISAKLVTLEEVYAQGFWGRDNPEKIKYFIKDALDNWGIKYVLLVGDYKKMPVRYVYNDEPWSSYPEPCFISELYYADIYDSDGNFSSWDTNRNGIYGEWKGNTSQDYDIDLHPDVYVGRLACRNLFEVKIVVNKIINYEKNTYDKEWFKRFVVVAGDDYPPGSYDFDTSDFEGELESLKAIENMTGFEPVKLWTSTGNFTGPKDVIKEFYKGAGFFMFIGHASPMSWATHPPEIEKNGTWVDGLKNHHIPLLWNGYKLPVVVAGACHNAQFDITPLNLLKDFLHSIGHMTYGLECWGWKLTSKAFGGSIATIGNTGLGMSKEDKESGEGAGDYLNLQFFYEYGTNGTSILGEVWGKSIDRYLDAYPIEWDTKSAWDYAYDAKTVQQWTLLGDPSLKIGGYLQ